ncbi:hypothetical protein [Cytobacillus oceanisediminis]|uniref:hypothetical protein n=1 Tax=Cytobacillus oceanisediminis TaxID=665099 RepID=UPI0037351554
MMLEVIITAGLVGMAIYKFEIKPLEKKKKELEKENRELRRQVSDLLFKDTQRLLDDAKELCNKIIKGYDNKEENNEIIKSLIKIKIDKLKSEVD